MWPHEGKPSDENILMTSEEEGWYLMDVNEIPELGDITKPIGLHSCLAHNCRHFTNEDCQLLGVDDTMAGYCWWCKEKVPDDLKSVWLLHNFEAAGGTSPSNVERLQEEVLDNSSFCFQCNKGWCDCEGL